MIYRDGMNPRVEKWKKELNLRGDVYIINHFIESLESHRKLFPNSTANTIEEAEHERILAIKEEAEKRSEQVIIQEKDPDLEPKEEPEEEEVHVPMEEPAEEPKDEPSEE